MQLKKIYFKFILRQSPNTGATNTSGFTALPGGDALNYPGFNLFESLSQVAVFWTSTENSATSAWYIGLYHNEARLYRSSMTKQVFGISGRCVQDTTFTPIPEAPSSGTHSSSETQIIWNWNTVTGATGCNWNPNPVTSGRSFQP